MRRLLLIGGLTYVVGSTCRVLAAMPWLLLVPVMPISDLGFFDWANFDFYLRLAAVLIGLTGWAVIAGMLISGNLLGAFVAVIALGCVGAIVAPIGGAILARWDTPERQFAERMTDGCEDHYEYSTKDGYCHYDHLYDDRDDTASNPIGDVVMVPHDKTTLYNNRPLPGALENITQLKGHAIGDPTIPHFVWPLATLVIVGWIIKRVIWHLAAPSSLTAPQAAHEPLQGMMRLAANDPRKAEIARRTRDFMSGRTSKF